MGLIVFLFKLIILIIILGLIPVLIVFWFIQVKHDKYRLAKHVVYIIFSILLAILFGNAIWLLFYVVFALMEFMKGNSVFEKIIRQEKHLNQIIEQYLDGEIDEADIRSEIEKTVQIELDKKKNKHFILYVSVKDSPKEDIDVIIDLPLNLGTFLTNLIYSIASKFSGMKSRELKKIRKVLKTLKILAKNASYFTMDGNFQGDDSNVLIRGGLY